MQYFDRLVAEAWDRIPPRFRRRMKNIALLVEDEPTPGQLARGRVPRGGTLLGLYEGRPLTTRSVEDSGRMPDVIYIFQESIQWVCDNEQELVEQVRKTVLHEIGHHFGMDEDDLSKLGYG